MFRRYKVVFILFKVAPIYIIYENVNQLSLLPSGFTHFTDGKTELHRGRFTWPGWRSSGTAERGFRSNLSKTEPKTKGGSRRAIFIVKGIFLRYILSTHYASVGRMWQSLFNVVDDHILLAVSSCEQELKMLPERQCSASGRRPDLAPPFRDFA